MFRTHYKRTALVATIAAMAGLAFAQSQPTTPAQSPTPKSSTPAQMSPSTPTQMPSMTPNKSETAVSAFQKLDAAHAGYVTKEQAAKLEGFDKSFTQADKNNDGKLDRDEFNAAWGTYSGKPQS
jgi:hypothetical protein